jgi:lipopolysaccharide transport system ATP-binding protein
MTAMQAQMTLEEVGCVYRVRHGLMRRHHYSALKSVSFTLYRGETLGLIGRNGAGKSTLLRLIAGILLPDSGRIITHGSCSISLLTLQLGFSAELSGRDNAIMGAMLMGYSRSQAQRRLPGIIEFSELGAWIDEPIKTYSSGMRARLGFSIAMETSPDVLLVDEVLGVGDEAFRAKSVAAMKEKMAAGQTVVFVSHQTPVMRELCHRIVWIEQGMTHMEGEVAEVLQAYHQSSQAC